MKGLIGTVVLALLLAACCATALAQGERVSIERIIEEANELGGWREEYEAHGRTIAVDIPIVIPQVESVPVVTASTWTASDSQALRALHQTEGIDLHSGDYAGVDKQLFAQLSDGGTGDTGASIQIGVDGMVVRVMFNSPEDLLSLHAEHHLKIRKQDYFPYQLSVEDAHAENNDMSLASAIEYVGRVLEYYLAPETARFALDFVELADRARRTKSLEDEAYGACVDYYEKGTYFIHFFQSVHGIPVMLPAYDGYENLLENRISYDRFVDWGNPGGLAQVMDKASFWVFFKWMKEESVEKEDLAFLPLSRIIRSIEDEIYRGHIRNVYSLRLGYTIFLNESSPETYTLFPMWVLECDYVESPDEEVRENPYTEEFREGFSFATLLINPQTSEISDRMHPKQADMDCPPIQ